MNSILRFKWCIYLVCFLLWACQHNQRDEQCREEETEAKKTTMFQNPIHSNGPDPWVFQDGSDYYLTFTTGHNLTVLKTSKLSDLSGAETVVVWNPPASGANSRDLWAPEIHLIEGKWYIYYAADDGENENHRMFVVSNANKNPLEGEWQDEGQLKLPDDRWAIDGTIFSLNGQLYFLWSGWEGSENGEQNIYICKMKDPLTPVGDRVLLTHPEYSWETNEVWPVVTEGPQILAHQDKLFLIYSAGGCWTDGYCLGMLQTNVGSEIMNPQSWIKSRFPVFSQNEEGNAFGPGHNSFFKSADGSEDWIIYHANPETGQGCGGARSIRIQPFGWTSEGLPDFGVPHPLIVRLNRPAGEE